MSQSQNGVLAAEEGAESGAATGGKKRVAKGPADALTRARLLQAAGDIIARDGADKFSLEAVAREAGFTKGALFHYFPSKSALLLALVHQIFADFEEQLAKEHAREQFSGPVGAWLRGFVHVTVPAQRAAPAFSGGLLAAITADPELRAVLRDAYNSYQTRAIAENSDVVLATIVRLACEGLWFSEVFDLSPPNGEMRRAVVQKLLDLASVAELNSPFPETRSS